MYIDKVHKKACQLLINPLLFSLPHETGGLERMLTMPEIHYIKHLRENDDLSISEIARKLGKELENCQKYADEEVYPSDTGGFVQKQE